MSDLKSLRAELKALRKEKSEKPVSKMRKSDIAVEIEKLKVARETTAAPAATPSGSMKKMAPASESIKEAKAMEFPVMPAKKETKKSEGTKKGDERKTARKAYEGEGSKKKDVLAKLMKMLESDSEED